jgi:hypothetical protein
VPRTKLLIAAALCAFTFLATRAHAQPEQVSAPPDTAQAVPATPDQAAAAAVTPEPSAGFHCPAPVATPGVPAGARVMTLSERLLLRQQWMTYREHDRQQIKLTGPVIGTLLGSAGLAAAGWLYTGNSKERVGATVLSIFFVAPVLTFSLVRLVHQVKKRRAIEREIWTAPPLTHAPLTWTF